MVEFEHSTKTWQPDDGGGGHSPLPKGEYVMHITESKKEEDHSGNGIMLLVLQPVESHHPTLFKRKMFVRLRMGQKTETKPGGAEKAREIARKKFSAIVEACGETHITNTNEIELTPFKAEVYHREYNGKTYEELGRVEYLPRDGAVKQETPDHDIF